MIRTGHFLQEKDSSCKKIAKNSVDSNRVFGKEKTHETHLFQGFVGGGDAGIRPLLPFGHTVFKTASL